YTGWLRRAARTGRVVYAGLYAVTRVPAEPGPCVQVSFPVPRGSVLVVLRPEAGADGSLRLVSGGAGFGGTGYYRLVARGLGRWAVRHVRTLEEVFHLYVDPAGVLRTDHEIRFLGLPVVRLHYKIAGPVERLPATPGSGACVPGDLSSVRFKPQTPNPHKALKVKRQ